MPKNLELNLVSNASITNMVMKQEFKITSDKFNADRIYT
jgi:hypothetical protein